MKKFFAKHGINEDGSVLLAVLSIMTFAAILAATALGFVETASNTTYVNEREKQAYYTASTCLETFVESVLTPNSPNWNKFVSVAEVGGQSDPIDLDGMGTCVITVQKPAGMNYIKVIATATMDTGEEQSVACIMKTTTTIKPSELNNALEVLGSTGQKWNNLSTLGNMSGSTDNDPNRVYYFRNANSKVYGSYFQYGSVAFNTGVQFNESVRGEGVSVTASRYISFSENTPSISSNVAKENNNSSNYVYAGTAFLHGADSSEGAPALGRKTGFNPDTGVRSGDIDLFSGGVVLNFNSGSADLTENIKRMKADLAPIADDLRLGGGANGYYQYGNIYCYKNGSIMEGDMVVYRNANIRGDVYVEGNLYVNGTLNITGNLYVLGTITGSPNVQADTERSDLTGRIYCGGTSGYNSLSAAEFNTVKSSARGTLPSLEYQGTKYVYYAEDMLLSTDSTISPIRSTYLGLVENNHAAAKKLSNYSGGTFEGINFDKIIDGSCYITAAEANNVRNVLIKVDSSDVVIVFEDGVKFNNGNGGSIVVKNSSKGQTNEHFCYFTIDTYTNAAKVEPVYKTDASGNPVLDGNGKKQVIDSTHSGFKTSGTFYCGTGFCLVDYDTWKNAKLGNGDRFNTINGVTGGSLPLNLTGTDIDGSYNPNYGYNIFLLTQGTMIYSDQAALFECSIFGREAEMTINNAPDIEFTLSADKTASFQTVVIGSAVLDNVVQSNSNVINFAFCPPSPGSMLSNAGGLTGGEDEGYEVLKYTQDLS